MKARILAIFILLIIIGIPAFLYWIFFHKNISQITVELDQSQDITVALKWTFSYGFLPLADRALNFEKNCEKICTFGPIPPAQYTITISWKWFSQITDTFSLKRGETLIKKFTLSKTTNYESIELPKSMSNDEKTLRQQDIQKILWENFFIINRDLRGRLWAYKNGDSTTNIGIFTGDRFISVRDFPFGFSSIELDFLKNILILNQNENKKILMTLEWENLLETQTPKNATSFSFYENNWYSQAEWKTLLYKNNSWSPNIRFSLFADFSHFRLGYIHANDIDLLKLGNYDVEKWSALVLINRKNGENYELARNIEVSDIFTYENNLIFISNGQSYKIVFPEF